METDCGVYKMPKCKALKSGLRLENAFSAFSAFSLVPLVQGFFSSFGVVNHEPSKVSGVSSGHMSVGRTKRPVWELRSLRQEGDRIILLFLQARWMHVLKWAAQNVPKSSKECWRVAQFCLLCVKSLKKLAVVCTGLTLLRICWPHLPHACYSNQWCGGRVWIITLSRFPCHIFLDTGVHRLLLTHNFRLFLSRARAHCVQGRLKFCILSFARVIDIDATAAKQVKTSVDKAARTWRRGCVCQTCRTVERKWKVRRQVYDCLWSCLSLRMPNRFRFVFGAAGFWFLKLLSGVGFKSFSAECRAASFRRSSLAVRFLCFSLNGIWHGCTFFMLFHFINELSPSLIAVSSLFGHTPSRMPNAQGSLQKGLPVNPNDFKSVGVPPFFPFTLTAYVHTQCTLYITVSLSYTFIYHLCIYSVPFTLISYIFILASLFILFSSFLLKSFLYRPLLSGTCNSRCTQIARSCTAEGASVAQSFNDFSDSEYQS